MNLARMQVDLHYIFGVLFSIHAVCFTLTLTSLMSVFYLKNYVAKVLTEEEGTISVKHNCYKRS